MSLIKKLRSITAEEKSKEVLKNTILSFGVKGLGMLLSLVSLPLYIRYFNNETALGLWYTLLSVLTWVNMFDFGLTNGLRNELVGAICLKDKKRIAELFSSTFSSLLILALALIALLFPLIYSIDLNAFFNISESVVSLSQLRTVFGILLVGTLLHFVLKTITSLIYALQKAAVNSFCTLCSSALPLAYMVLTLSLNLSLYQKMWFLAVIHIFSSWVPLLICFVIIKCKNPLIKQVKFLHLSSLKLKTAMEQLKIGSHFFIAQGAFLIITQTNEYMISACFAPEYVVTFRAYNSLFLLVSSIFQVALSSVWSSVTKACAQNDMAWLRKLTKILYACALLVTVSELVIIPLTPWIFKIWLGENSIPFSPIYSLVFAVYGSLYIYNIIITTIANGMGKLKPQIVFYSIGAVCKISFVLLIRHFFAHLWISVILATVFALALFCIVQTIHLNGTIKSTMSKKASALQNQH